MTSSTLKIFRLLVPTCFLHVRSVRHMRSRNSNRNFYTNFSSTPRRNNRCLFPDRLQHGPYRNVSGPDITVTEYATIRNKIILLFDSVLTLNYTTLSLLLLLILLRCYGPALVTWLVRMRVSHGFRLLSIST